MQAKTTSCIECGAALKKRTALRCKPCAMRKRFADERSELPLPNPSGLCQCGCGGTTPLAEATRIKFGLVRGEHTRWMLGHQARKEPREDTGGALFIEEDRGYFTPCHIWQGMKNQHGYAMRRHGSRRIGVHREKFEERNGPLLDGMVPDHLCRQRDCINVEHMEAVTRGENVLRGMSPKIVAWRSGTCTKGHPRTAENSYVSAAGRQICRICRNEYKRSRHAGHSSDSVPSTGILEPSNVTQ